MNRLEKEKLRKYREARAGKTAEEIAEIDRLEAIQQAIEERAEWIHEELFPEEYDFIYDSTADAAARRRGDNPMSDEYTTKVAARRKKLGVSPLSVDGTPSNRDSWELAYAKAKSEINKEPGT